MASHSSCSSTVTSCVRMRQPARGTRQQGLRVHAALDFDVEAIHRVDRGSKHHTRIRLVGLGRVVGALQLKLEATEDDGHHDHRLHERELVSEALAWAGAEGEEGVVGVLLIRVQRLVEVGLVALPLGLALGTAFVEGVHQLGPRRMAPPVWVEAVRVVPQERRAMQVPDRQEKVGAFDDLDPVVLH